MTRFTFLLISAFLLLTAPFVAAQPVTVFAAASLRGAVDEIASGSGQDVRASYGGSGTMARQVAAGAPADVVILANALWMDWLVTQNITGADTAQIIARNALVLIAPKGAAPLTTPDDIPTRLDRGRLAMGHRDAVPAGAYARQWLQSVALWSQVNTRLAETDNVRAALTLVARGDVPLGIVYATDAQAEPAVEVLWQIPEGDHDPITYLAAALTPSGADFLAHLTDPEAAAIFAAHGYLPVTP